MENTQKNIEKNLQSSKKHSYNLHSPGVRTYKDSVFCRIFNEKKEVLSLYNALNMSHYENPDDLEIITLDNALFLQMKNDVAFLINTNEMCLIEHSSTVCLNYPLRSLLYLAREYEVILEQRNENILKYGLVKIPTPACIVLYNGMEKRPEVEILKLSNAFENQEVKPCLELFVKVLNINDGMNENVLNGCKTLKDYVILISKIRENYNEIGDLAKAIHKAVDYCIDADHLRSFLIRNRAEVEPTLLRVPGIGVKSAKRIVSARRYGKLEFSNLKKMGVALKRAAFFITCNGKTMMPLNMNQDYIARSIADIDRKNTYAIDNNITYTQMNIFDMGVN